MFNPVFEHREFSDAENVYAAQRANITTGDAFSTGLESFFENGLFTSGSLAAVRAYSNITEENISPEEANKRYGTDKLKFDAPLSDFSAAMLRARHDSDNQKQEVLSKSKSTIALFGAGLAAGFLDPVEFGLNFVPVTWAAKSVQAGRLFTNAEMAARLTGKTIGARALTRVAEGALEGGVGGVIGSGANWYLMNQEQKDYTSNDFVRDVAFSTLMGSVLQPSIGAVSDVVERSVARKRIGDVLPSHMQMEAVRLANAGIYDFDKVLELMPGVKERELNLGRSMTQDERIEFLSKPMTPEVKSLKEKSTVGEIELAKKDVQQSERFGYSDDMLKLAEKKDQPDLKEINSNFVVQSNENGRPVIRESSIGDGSKKSEGIKVVDGVSFLKDQENNSIAFKSDESISNIKKVSEDAKRIFRGEDEILLKKPTEGAQSRGFIDSDGTIYRKDSNANGSYYEKIGDLKSDNLQKVLKDNQLSQVERNKPDEKLSSFSRVPKQKVVSETYRALTESVNEKPESLAAPIETKSNSNSIADAKSIDEQIESVRSSLAEIERPKDKSMSEKDINIREADEAIQKLPDRMNGFKQAINCILGAL